METKWRRRGGGVEELEPTGAQCQGQKNQNLSINYSEDGGFSQHWPAPSGVTS